MSSTATDRSRVVTPTPIAAEPTDTDPWNAELASLIRRLAAQRPDILTHHPRSTAHPAPEPPPRPTFLTDPETGRPLTRDDFPVDPDTLNHIAHLRALTNGNHRPGRHWPTHTTATFRAKAARPSLRRRLTRRLTHTARTICTAVGALTITALPLAALLLNALPAPG